MVLMVKTSYGLKKCKGFFFFFFQNAVLSMIAFSVHLTRDYLALEKINLWMKFLFFQFTLNL